MADSSCPKRHPTEMVKCTRGPDHKGAHGFVDRLEWTDDEARKTFEILVSQYEGIISWPRAEEAERTCARCQRRRALRECAACGVSLCPSCLLVENCAHTHSGAHAVLVSRPM